jgi:hypothetical protein
MNVVIYLTMVVAALLPAAGKVLAGEAPAVLQVPRYALLPKQT